MKKFLLLLPLILFVTQAQAAIVNVALDAPAFANGPLYGNDLVARLTDGRRTPQIHADVSPPTGFAYWVDLGVPRALTEIKIYPRQDACCPDRFSNVRVSVHDDDGLDNIGPEVWRIYVVDDQGALRKHVNIFLGNSWLRDRERLSDSIPPGTVVYVMQALSGG